jgi:hypothetical protein
MRNIWKSKWENDGFRSLYESVIYPEVIKALDDWKRFGPDNCVLIGGLALSYYVKPRPTEDIDLIFLSEEDVPKEVYRFKKNRKHSFEHTSTGVEIETLTPEHLKRTRGMFKKVFDTAIESDGIKVASPLSIIALKLGRFNLYDRADIVKLIKHCRVRNIEIDFTGYDLTPDEINRFNTVTDEDDTHNDLLISETTGLISDGTPYKEFKINNELSLRIFKETFGDPRMTLSRNGDQKIRRFGDFEICMTIDGEKVIETSTGFNSFAGFPDQETEFKNWFGQNRDKVHRVWVKLNE